MDRKPLSQYMDTVIAIINDGCGVDIAFAEKLSDAECQCYSYVPQFQVLG